MKILIILAVLTLSGCCCYTYQHRRYPDRIVIYNGYEEHWYGCEVYRVYYR